jgi:hypothetical protein
MLKKHFVILAAASLLLVTPAIASRESDNNQPKPQNELHQNSLEQHDNDKDHDDKQKDSLKPEASCDPSANWDSHGKYVSCVAHKDSDGDHDVDDAAHSEIGKEHHHPKPSTSADPSVTPLPTQTPSPFPTASVTPTPTISPSPTDSAFPSATPIIINGEDGEKFNGNKHDALGFEKLMESIQKLFENFFHHGK